jgi:sugar/nucleoside kinase (ribokinase family)
MMSAERPRGARGTTERAFERLVLVGSVIVDVVLHVPALPERGGDVIATDSRTAVGAGFNVLSAAARLGLPAAYAGLVGDGPFARQIESALRAEGIEMLLEPLAGIDSGFCVALVEPQGERTFATTLGAEARLDPSRLEHVRLRPTDVVYVSGYDLVYPHGPAIGSWLARQDPCVAVVLDPGPLVAEVPEALLHQVLKRLAWLSLNRRELHLLQPEPDSLEPDSLEAAARRLRARLGPTAGLVVRDGAAGCRLFDARHDGTTVPAPPVTPVDTNGAGDVHVGAFLAALVAGADVESAARTANVAAAVSTTRPGPANGPDARTVSGYLTADGQHAARS